jgi:hypothetical protein
MFSVRRTLGAAATVVTLTAALAQGCDTTTCDPTALTTPTRPPQGRVQTADISFAGIPGGGDIANARQCEVDSIFSPAVIIEILAAVDLSNQGKLSHAAFVVHINNLAHAYCTSSEADGVERLRRISWRSISACETFVHELADAGLAPPKKACPSK